MKISLVFLRPSWQQGIWRWYLFITCPVNLYLSFHIPNSSIHLFSHSFSLFWPCKSPIFFSLIFDVYLYISLFCFESWRRKGGEIKTKIPKTNFVYDFSGPLLSFFFFWYKLLLLFLFRAVSRVKKSEKEDIHIFFAAGLSIPRTGFIMGLYLLAAFLIPLISAQSIRK